MEEQSILAIVKRSHIHSCSCSMIGSILFDISIVNVYVGTFGTILKLTTFNTDVGLMLL